MTSRRIKLIALGSLAHDIADYYDRSFRAFYGGMFGRYADFTPSNTLMSLNVRWNNLFYFEHPVDRDARTTFERVARSVGRGLVRFTHNIEDNPFNWVDSNGHSVYRMIINGGDRIIHYWLGPVPGMSVFKRITDSVSDTLDSVMFTIIAIGQMGARITLEIGRVMDESFVPVYTITRRGVQALLTMNAYTRQRLLR